MKAYPVLGTIPASGQAALMAYLTMKDVTLASVSTMLGLRPNALSQALYREDTPEYIVDGMKTLGIPPEICPEGVPKGSIKVARVVQEHAQLNAGRLAAGHVQ